MARNEPTLWTNTRTDADSYAEHSLDDLLTHAAIASARTQCYVLDALAEAFRAGEDQGECRAIRILAIARANATSKKARAALEECLQLLAPEVTK